MTTQDDQARRKAEEYFNTLAAEGEWSTPSKCDCYLHHDSTVKHYLAGYAEGQKDAETKFSNMTQVAILKHFGAK